ncbi:MAG: hypothetical protein ABR508_03490 [Candidatus Baltobacteraceae bacterium]
MSDANHSISSHYRINGNFSRAWEAYRSSIRSWTGLKYVPYAVLLLGRQTRPAKDVIHPLAAAFEKYVLSIAPRFSLRRPAQQFRRVALSGLPLFCSRLARQLDRHGMRWTPERVGARTHLDVLAAFFTILKCDLWYSIGEPRSDRRIEWFAREINRRRVIHWVGSDVTALQNPRVAKILSGPRFTHLVEAQWIADELRAAGLTAHIVPLPPNSALHEIPPLPGNFTILLYVPRTRGSFYGLQEFERTMVSLSHLPIEYLIVGGGAITVPPNVRATNLGWLEDLTGVYRRSSLLVRFTRHDGLSLMVLEALAAGRYVLWTQAFPFCHTVKTRYDMEREVTRLFEMHAAGILHPQTDASRMVRAQYSETACVHKLVAAWETCMTEPSGNAAARMKPLLQAPDVRSINLP